MKNCGVEIHVSQKWYPPPPEETFFIAVGGGIIFINTFLFRVKLSSDIVAILECTKRTEFVMHTFFQITAPPKPGRELGPT